VGQGKQKNKLFGVRAILGVRSRYVVPIWLKEQDIKIEKTCTMCKPSIQRLRLRLETKLDETHCLFQNDDDDDDDKKKYSV
jgi:hypothetical protein